MSTPPSIVLFDIGNVLIEWNPYKLFEHLIPDNAERAHFHEVICPRDWWVAHDAGATFEEIADPVCARFPDKHDLIWAWHNRYLELMPSVITGSVDVLGKLRERGVPVHGLTNWAADKFQIALKEYPFLSWFEDVTVSGEVGMIKPDPAIFYHSLNRMQAEPGTVFFIDDHAPNIAAAKALGFHTHHFANPDALRKDLVAYGLL